MRTRRFRLAHIAALPARAVVGRVAPCSSCDYRTGVAAVVMVADALAAAPEECVQWPFLPSDFLSSFHDRHVRPLFVLLTVPIDGAAVV